MSCVISTTPTPRSSTSRRIRARIWRRIAASSAVVGSSATISSGSVQSASAITTRWRMPPENSCGWSSMRRSGDSIPVSASSATARSRASRAPTSACAAIVSTSCSPTVISGFRLVCGSWKIIEMRLPRSAWRASRSSPSMRRPSSRTSPAATRPVPGSSPVIAAPIVDFPAPDSPTRPTISPARTLMSTSSTAVSSPKREPKRTVRPEISSSGVPVASPGPSPSAVPLIA